MRLILLFCAALFISGCASTGGGASKQHGSNDFSDAHSQSVFSILQSINAPTIVRISMKNEFDNADPALPDAYVECIFDGLTDDVVYGYMIPVYRRHIEAESANKLATFFKTDVGKKYAILARIGGGEQLQAPTIDPVESMPYADILPLMLELSRPELIRDLQNNGYTMGMRLAEPCIGTVTHPVDDSDDDLGDSPSQRKN